MSFYGESKNCGCPKYTWIKENVNAISVILDELYKADTNDSNTPEIRIACQKLEEAEYWLKRSNYQWDSIEQMAEHFGVELKEDEKKVIS